jgi:hypothetical protein
MCLAEQINLQRARIAQLQSDVAINHHALINSEGAFTALGKTAADWLDIGWHDLRNDKSPTRISHLTGAILLAVGVGILSADEGELWCRRLMSCPGHDDEGGRNWCAYCGDMPEEQP